MSDTGQEQKTPQVPQQTRGQRRAPGAHAARPAPAEQRAGAAAETSGWVGWILFASMMMVVVGFFQVVLGLTAIFDDGYYLVTQDALLINADYTAWGWVHLALGAVAIAAAAGLLAGQMWARVVGIAMALVSSVVNLAFMAAYPLWSIMVIALDVLVIYAIAAHGRELETA
ncbi:MAG TPA: hypothetical protein VLB29_01670 [Nocardioidaceae bacterium]|nr:hypothetical protein [Nocardioidaceae bacterium]